MYPTPGEEQRHQRDDSEPGELIKTATEASQVIEVQISFIFSTSFQMWFELVSGPGSSNTCSWSRNSSTELSNVHRRHSFFWSVGPSHVSSSVPSSVLSPHSSVLASPPCHLTQPPPDRAACGAAPVAVRAAGGGPSPTANRSELTATGRVPKGRPRAAARPPRPPQLSAGTPETGLGGGRPPGPSGRCPRAT